MGEGDERGRREKREGIQHGKTETKKEAERRREEHKLKDNKGMK